jgi:hypothetical protein
MLLAVDVKFANIDATSITFGDTNFLNPPATVDIKGVVELADDTEAQALTDALRALTPRGLGLVFTAAKILQRLMTVDGSGSGLDADLVDGRHASDFALLSGARWGDGGIGGIRLSPAASPTAGSGQIELYNAAGARVGFIYQPSSGLGAGTLLFAKDDGNGFTFAGGTLRSTGQIVSDVGIAIGPNGVWTSGNDGAGSGLDADLLDGWQRDEVRDWNNLLNKPGSFPPSGFSQSLNGSGYQVLPSGQIPQWGGGAHADSSGAQRIDFPIAFPNSCFRVIACNSAEGPPTAFHGTGSYDRFGATIYSSQSIGNPSGAGTAFNWVAIGH